MQTEQPEKLITLQQAADALGVPYYKVQRAGKAGLFPTYRLYNSRRLVRLSEVIAAIEATRQGAAMREGPFSTWAPQYRKAGYHPRPILPGAKACKIPGWQQPDVSDDEFEDWIRRCADHGIGLLMGSAFPDGSILGALDIDHDAFVRVARYVLGEPPCGRVGKRGIALFVRVQRGTPSEKSSRRRS